MKTKHYALLAFLLAATLFTGEARAASALGQRLSGKILLQVEANGEGWYIYPKTFKRYYLGRPDDAFRIMRELSLGVSNKDFESFGMYAPSRLRGLILLKVEDAGRAYYVHPDTRRMHYLGRPQDAFDVMRTQGLGITNKDLASLEAENGYQNSQPQKPSYPVSAAGWKPPSTCSGTDVTFTSSPVPVSEIYHIEPMGKVAAGHVTPTDHGYIANSANHQPAISDLRAPADGHIVSIGAFGKPNDYRIIIWHSCTVSTIYIHVHELAPEILAITGDLGPGKSWEGDHGPDNNKTPTIPVKAGQVIGKMNRSLDFSVHDTAVALAGFENPALYYGEQWKIHTVDLFGYFESSLRSQLKAKSLRAAEPVGGKIDFDKPGRLVGSWFREGTDYRGEGADCTYYECHLAFAYNHIDPNWVRISVPDSGIEESACNVCFGAFGVKGNGPDPATITPESGLVKYELVGRHDIENIDSNVLGTMLVEMLAPRRIKVEVFPGKTAGEAAAFTSAAHLYER